MYGDINCTLRETPLVENETRADGRTRKGKRGKV